MADAQEAGQKVEVPERAAEFAVGDGGEAVVELLLHERADRVVLDARELFAGDLARFELAAGGVDFGGAQEAADDVGAVRGQDVSHGGTP